MKMHNLEAVIRDEGRLSEAHPGKKIPSTQVERRPASSREHPQSCCSRSIKATTSTSTKALPVAVVLGMPAAVPMPADSDACGEAAVEDICSRCSLGNGVPVKRTSGPGEPIANEDNVITSPTSGSNGGPEMLKSCARRWYRLFPNQNARHPRQMTVIILTIMTYLSAPSLVHTSQVFLVLALVSCSHCPSSSPMRILSRINATTLTKVTKRLQLQKQHVSCRLPCNAP